MEYIVVRTLVLHPDGALVVLELKDAAGNCRLRLFLSVPGGRTFKGMEVPDPPGSGEEKNQIKAVEKAVTGELQNAMNTLKEKGIQALNQVLDTQSS